MPELEDHIKSVYTKLQQLLKQYAMLQKDNERVKEELVKAKQTQAQQVEHIDQLKQQVLILKSAAGKMTEPDKKAFEKNINLYIKEIDKCIGLLSE